MMALASNGATLQKQRRLAVGLLGALIVLLSACASADKSPPLGLGTNPGLLKVRLAWASNLGGSGQFVGVSADAAAQQVLVNTSQGGIFKLDANDGSLLSRMDAGQELTSAFINMPGGSARSGAPISGAVIAEGNALLLTGVEGQGFKSLRLPLPTAVHTPPLLAGGRAFVLGADRSVKAFDASTGQLLWNKNHAADPLALRAPGVLLAVRGTLVASLGNRLAGIDPNSSNVLWDVAIGSPRGTNDVERLADVVAPVTRFGDQVCARAFQTAVACIDAGTGQLQWRKNDLGTTGLTGDATLIFGADADGRINAWRRSDGERMWTTDRLRYRELTTPVALGAQVVVADTTGRVYWFDRDNGVLQQWMDTDDSGVALSPVQVGKHLVFATRNGGIYAFALSL
jgi:outer membrane protein assembly factor BamB